MGRPGALEREVVLVLGQFVRSPLQPERPKRVLQVRRHAPILLLADWADGLQSVGQQSKIRHDAVNLRVLQLRGEIGFVTRLREQATARFTRTPWCSGTRLLLPHVPPVPSPERSFSSVRLGPNTQGAAGPTPSPKHSLARNTRCMSDAFFPVGTSVRHPTRLRPCRCTCTGPDFAMIHTSCA